MVPHGRDAMKEVGDPLQYGRKFKKFHKTRSILKLLFLYINS